MNGTVDHSTLIKLAHASKRLREIEEAKIYEGSLYKFLEASWQFIDPAEFVGGWHMEAICEHLEAVTKGYIKRLLINIPPRMSKPVSRSAIITCKNKGLIPLGEIEVGDEVLTHKGRWRRVTGVHQQGVIRSVRLTTKRGRIIDAAPDHLFLTPEGWVQVGDLEPDDVVGIVPCTDECGLAAISAKEARLLGYLVGDGSCHGTPNITCADDIEAADIEACARAVGFTPTQQTYHVASSGYLLRRIALTAPHDRDRRRKGYIGPVRQWLIMNGLENKNSYNKRIPNVVMQGSNEIARAFIAAYWACDGYVSPRGPKRSGVARDDLGIGCDSVSHELLLDMQILLTRLGISSSVWRKVSKITTKKQGDKYTSYKLILSTQDDCWRFANLIEIPHSKNSKLAEARKRRFDFDRTIWGDVVASVEPIEDTDCVCLTVDEDHSFVANGFAVHNSSIISVAWPAWTWIQNNNSYLEGPQVQFLFASYAESLAVRDSIKTRRLIESPWYQKYWGNRFVLTSDQNTKIKFENNHKGYRFCTSVGGTVTGEGGAILAIDDAHKADEVESDTMRESVLTWYDEVFFTRRNDPRRSAIVVIGQRVHQNDISGHLLESGEFSHLMIPMEYEIDRHCVTVLKNNPDGSQIIWEDPRSEEGEPLCEGRYGESEIEEQKKSPFVWAGQFQQRPAPKGGAIIRREWWKVWERDRYPNFEYLLASVDTAYTEKQENDPSALTIWGIFRDDAGNPRVMLVWAWRDWLEFPDLCQKILDICTVDGRTGKVGPDGKMAGFGHPRFSVDRIIVEAKASGHSIVQELHKMMRWRVPVEAINYSKGRHTPDKTARLYSVQHLFTDGMIWTPDRKFADMVIDECEIFPRGTHDDLVDTVSMGLRYLRDAGFALMREEFSREVVDDLMFRPSQGALYPV